MVKEAKANSRLSNNLLLIILVVLILLIIGLIIGIVVGNINNNNNIDDSGSGGGESTGAAYGAEAGEGYTDYRTEDLQELNQKVNETEDVETARSIYEEYIDSTSDSLNRELAKSEYGIYLVDQGMLNDDQEMMDEGLQQLQGVNPDGFDVEQQLAYWSGFRQYYETTGDEEAYNEYNDKIRDIITNSDMPKGGN